MQRLIDFFTNQEWFYDPPELITAAERGDVAEVTALFPNVDDKDNKGRTALMYAVINEHKGTVEMLINKYHANVEAEDNEGLTPLMFAVIKGHKDMAEMLISKYNAKVEAKNNKRLTALICAAIEGNKNMAEMLISKYNAKVEAKNNNGLTALMCAAIEGHKDMAEMLISKYNAKVEAKNNNGLTALMCAVITGHKDIAEILIRSGANMEAENNEGHTVLLIAIYKQNTDVVNMLISVGADLTNVDLSTVGLSHVNVQNQIQFMFTCANEILKRAENSNKPFLNSLDDKIHQIRIEVNRISRSEMPVDEKRKALGEINKQLLKFQSLRPETEKLQEEKLQAESINTAIFDFVPKLQFESNLTQIVTDFAGSQRAQVEEILSNIPVAPVAPTQVSYSSITRISPTLGVGAPIASNSFDVMYRST